MTLVKFGADNLYAGILNLYLNQFGLIYHSEINVVRKNPNNKL